MGADAVKQMFQDAYPNEEPDDRAGFSTSWQNRGEILIALKAFQIVVARVSGDPKQLLQADNRTGVKGECFPNCTERSIASFGKLIFFGICHGGFGLLILKVGVLLTESTCAIDFDARIAGPAFGVIFAECAECILVTGRRWVVEPKEG